MKNLFCFLAFVIVFIPSKLFAQLHINTDTLSATNNEKTQVIKLSCDSLSCTFLIIIPDKVKSHYHSSHTENIYILDGNAIMKLGDKEFEIKKGDLVIIPCKTIHSVTNQGTKPLKVISIQSPFFDGKDRILVDE
ncbi:MAG: cupin domain-containing protein [Bacteroidia bacterium]|nr:cupin domain-containing protein [Bacteroidia bacterium]